MFDVIIAGAGPAGLSAALVLGRCRRRVLICDSGKPRNRVTRALHGFLSRDGIDPLELRRIGREQLAEYDTVVYREGAALTASRGESRFTVTFRDGTIESARIILLATGLVDVLPEIPGIDDFYGKSVFHCPYCDGWEWRDRRIAVYGRGDKGGSFALELMNWSGEILLCSDGEAPGDEMLQRLREKGVRVRAERVERLEGERGILQRISFGSGAPETAEVLFFRPAQYQHSPLAEQLGCPPGEEGMVPTGKFQTTDVPGVYLAGDAAESVQLAIIAAAEGAEAAFAINTALLKEEGLS